MKILYFTATGNSLYIAKSIGAVETRNNPELEVWTNEMFASRPIIC